MSTTEPTPEGTGTESAEGGESEQATGAETEGAETPAENPDPNSPSGEAWEAAHQAGKPDDVENG